MCKSVLTVIITRCIIYFVFFIFVVYANHENIFTTKISRSTVSQEILMEGQLELSIILWVFAVEGCPLSRDPLYRIQTYKYQTTVV